MPMILLKRPWAGTPIERPVDSVNLHCVYCCIDLRSRNNPIDQVFLGPQQYLLHGTRATPLTASHSCCTIVHILCAQCVRAQQCSTAVGDKSEYHCCSLFFFFLTVSPSSVGSRYVCSSCLPPTVCVARYSRFSSFLFLSTGTF